MKANIKIISQRKVIIRIKNTKQNEMIQNYELTKNNKMYLIIMIIFNLVKVKHSVRYNIRFLRMYLIIFIKQTDNESLNPVFHGPFEV